MKITQEGIEFFNIFAFLEALYKSYVGEDAPSILTVLSNFWEVFFPFYLFFAFVFSVVLIIAIVMVIRKERKLVAKLKSKEPEYLSGEDYPPVSQGNPRWEEVLRLLGSENPNDWRLAILEADIILDELVERMGYKGDTLGDKMKNIEKSDFRPLDEAWEAHKVRNILAHRGSDYILTKREARRVIDLYARVFEEFHFI